MLQRTFLRQVSSHRLCAFHVLNNKQYNAATVDCQSLCHKKVVQNMRYSNLSTSRWPKLVPPLPALTLGGCGLIPFFTPPLYMMYNNGIFCSDGEMMHLVYSASILAFLGGVRWGFTLPDGSQQPTWKNLIYSVTPALMSWAGVLLHSPLGYIPITAGLAACCVIDVVWPGYPFWFKILRIILTSGALLSTFLLFKVKYNHDKTLGAQESIEGFRKKFYDWKNGDRE